MLIEFRYPNSKFYFWGNLKQHLDKPSTTRYSIYFLSILNNSPELSTVHSWLNITYVSLQMLYQLYCLPYIFETSG